VSQIQRLRTLDEPFERPAGFVLAEHWRSYLDAFEARLHSGDAVVRFSPAARTRLADLMSQPVVAAVAAGEPDGAGWVAATIPIESVSHAAGLLRFGAEVEVVGPAELRTHMAETAAALTRLYAGPVDSAAPARTDGET
jgi:predicted DNA-binding transcriptional regulator YafY